MKKIFYYVLALILMVMPLTVKAEVTSNTNTLNNLATPALNMVSSNYNSVSFSITKVDGAIGYYIERSVDANFSTFETINTTSLSYVDKNLNTGSTYYYRIQAYGKNNILSAKSTVISTKLDLDKPEILLNRHSYKSLKLDIKPVLGASYYEVKVGNYNSVVRTFNTTELSNVIDGLNYNTLYDITVTAYASNGAKSASSIDSLRTEIPKPEVKAVTTGDGVITISYGAIADVSTYVIYRSCGYGSQEEIVRTTGTSYVDTNLNINERYYYRVEAISSDGTNTYSVESNLTNGIYPMKTLTKPSFSVRKSKDGYYGNSIHISIRKVANADRYLLYEKVNNEFKYIDTLYTDLEYNYNYIEYGNHVYAVRAYNATTGVYSDYSIVNFNYNPEVTSVSIKRLNYNRNQLTIKSPHDFRGDPLAYNTSFKYEIYRSTDNKNYKLIKTLNGNYNNTVYTDTISGVKVGTTYYYRVKVVVNNSRSSYSNTVGMKSYITKPSIKVKNDGIYRNITVSNVGSGVKYIYYESTSKNGKYKKIYEGTKYSIARKADWRKNYYYKVGVYVNGKKYTETNIATSLKGIKTPNISVYNSTNDTQTIKFTNLGKGVKYRVYQSTKKNGKYKQVCNTSKNSCTVKVKWNKTYYYKVRAYVNINKKNVYTPYSKVKSRKVNMVALDKYPIKLYTTYNTSRSVIKSVNINKKSSGNYSKYTFIINYASKYSSYNRTAYSTVYFYNYNYTKKYTYTLYEYFKKGTVKNTKTSFNIKLPKWAMYYDFY